jgi:hypothetical protein
MPDGFFLQLSKALVVHHGQCEVEDEVVRLQQTRRMQRRVGHFDAQIVFPLGDVPLPDALGLRVYEHCLFLWGELPIIF